MASRTGPRAAGTDGNDYSHREIIKEQYYISDQDKKSLSRLVRNSNRQIMNTDPGVKDDAEDLYYDGRVINGGYGDEGEFFEELQNLRTDEDTEDIRMTDIVQEEVEKQQKKDEAKDDLVPSSDYRGMGGPESVPLLSRGAFEVPQTLPHKKCLLDELYLAPSPEHIRAFKRIEQMKENAQNKSRLKWTITCHFMLFVLLAVKMVPEILDKLDIFVLEIEELFIPKADAWEFAWISSILFTILGLYASKKSKASIMTKFICGIVFLALIPVFFGFAIHFSDFLDYVTNRKISAGMSTWRGYPVALFWYAFLFVAMQVHFFELYFAFVLRKAWQPKKKSQ